MRVLYACVCVCVCAFFSSFFLTKGRCPRRSSQAALRNGKGLRDKAWPGFVQLRHFCALQGWPLSGSKVRSDGDFKDGLLAGLSYCVPSFFSRSTGMFFSCCKNIVWNGLLSSWTKSTQQFCLLTKKIVWDALVCEQNYAAEFFFLQIRSILFSFFEKKSCFLPCFLFFFFTRALLNEMTERGIRPDKVSFAAAMQASAAGFLLLPQAKPWKILRAMHRIMPCHLVLIAASFVLKNYYLTNWIDDNRQRRK